MDAWFAEANAHIIIFMLTIAVKLITAGLDRGLNEHKYIVPGLGDYGDRYFNTVA